jgi:hypothetical protein
LGAGYYGTKVLGYQESSITIEETGTDTVEQKDFWSGFWSFPRPDSVFNRHSFEGELGKG